MDADLDETDRRLLRLVFEGWRMAEIAEMETLDTPEVRAWLERVIRKVQTTHARSSTGCISSDWRTWH